MTEGPAVAGSGRLRPELLLRCCACPAWVRLVTAAAPYADVDELIVTGRRAWESLEPADWREALAAHPRIGDRPPPGSQEAVEQSGADGADSGLLDQLGAGNAAYEERFGMTYVVRAAGRSAQEMLDLLRSRLTAEPADELVTAAGQQWEITELRLRAAFAQ